MIKTLSQSALLALPVDGASEAIPPVDAFASFEVQPPVTVDVLAHPQHCCVPAAQVNPEQRAVNKIPAFSYQCT